MNDMESMVHHFNLVMDGLKAPPGKSYFEVEGSKGTRDERGQRGWLQARSMENQTSFAHQLCR